MKTLENLQLTFLILFITGLSISMAASNLFFYLTILVSIILWFKERKRLNFEGILFPYTLLITWGLITLTWSPDPATSFKSFKFIHFLIFPVILNMRFKENLFKYTILILAVLNSLFLFAAPFISTYNSDFPVFRRLGNWAIRYSGCFTISISYGNFLSMIILSLLVYVLYSEKNTYYRAVEYSMIITLIFALLLTTSRAAWLGFTIGFFIFSFMLFKNNTKIYLIIIFIFSILLITIPPFKNLPVISQISQRIEETVHGYSSGRGVLFKTGVLMFKENPLFGGGIGFVKEKYGIYVNKLENIEAARKKMRYSHLHNNFLQILVEWGLIGLLLFLYLLFSLFRIFYERIINIGNNPYYSAGIALISAHIITGVFEYNFFYSNVARLFWYIIPLILMNGDNYHNEKILSSDSGIDNISSEKLSR